MRICEIDECNNKHQAKGFCREHYKINRRKEFNYVRPLLETFCSKENCKTIEYSSGVCRKHWTISYRNGDYNKSGASCIATWCENIGMGTRGRSVLCYSCYSKVQKYNITLEEFLKQPRSCEICGGNWRLSIDHNHQTMAVRGILCSLCNTSLGTMKEDKKALIAMVKYIEKYE
jgi:hypothetical protein